MRSFSENIYGNLIFFVILNKETNKQKKKNGKLLVTEITMFLRDQFLDQYKKNVYPVYDKTNYFCLTSLRNLVSTKYLNRTLSSSKYGFFKNRLQSRESNEPKYVVLKFILLQLKISISRVHLFIHLFIQSSIIGH